MSNLPKTLELDRRGIERLPVGEEVKIWLRQLCDKLDQIYTLQRNAIVTLDERDHIADADGTLADITTKFNTLLSQLEAQKLLADS